MYYIYYLEPTNKIEFSLQVKRPGSEGAEKDNCTICLTEFEQGEDVRYRIYSSISRTFLYLKISPKTGVRLILEASKMTCSNHGTYTYENMRLPYLF